jgi:hypothetical protein
MQFMTVQEAPMACSLKRTWMQTKVRAAGVAKCIVAAHNGLRLDKKPGQPTFAQSR